MGSSNPALRTLCIIHQGSRVLLGFKKRGFGAGRWNGFGGKVEPGETIVQAAVREVAEEAEVDVAGLTERGVLNFTFASGLQLEVHVFVATRVMGEPHETEEMRPQWFTIDTIPYQQMWAVDTHWLPLLLAGKSFIGAFHFQDEQHLLTHDVKEVAPS